MSSIDSFWRPGRDNPRRKPRFGKHRASRGTESFDFVTRTPTGKTVDAGTRHVRSRDSGEKWVNRTSIESPHGEMVPYGSFSPVAAPRKKAGMMDWVRQHRLAVAAGAGGIAVLAMAKSATASTVAPAPAASPEQQAAQQQVSTETANQSQIGRLLGAGLFVAVATGVLIYAAENQ